MRRAAAALGVALAIACGGDREPARGVVTDALGLFDAREIQALERHHAVLLRDHDIDYRVDVVGGAGDRLAYGVKRFQTLEVGSRSASGRGLLLVLDPVQDAVRLEVGRNLEGVYPDVFVASVEHEQMVPFFRRGRVADGILATTELIVSRAQEAQAGRGFARPGPERADGGGAEARARLGAGDDDRPRAGPDVAARETPVGTVNAYLEAMAAGNARPDLDLYSRASREWLRGRVMTPAQMASEVRAQRRCRRPTLHVDDSGTRAVIRYPVAARTCPPWLLVREDGRWRLDLATAGRAVRFGAGNAWHFATGADSAVAAERYAFAFRDWRLDANGFPHPEQEVER